MAINQTRDQQRRGIRGLIASALRPCWIGSARGILLNKTKSYAGVKFPVAILNAGRRPKPPIDGPEIARQRKLFLKWFLVACVVIVSIELMRKVEAQDYYATPAPSWPAPQLRYANAGGCSESFMADMSYSFDTWSTLPAVRVADAPSGELDGIITISCAPFLPPPALTELPEGWSMASDYLTTESGYLAVGRADVSWNWLTIKDCSIHISTLELLRLEITGEMTQRLAVLHEGGHCLGLPHSGNPRSTMFSFPPLDAVTLHADDIRRAWRLYWRCDQATIIDRDKNQYISRARLLDATTGGYLSGYIEAGDVWPDDVQHTELSRCAR